MRLFLITLVSAILACGVSSAQENAQSYPSRPIKIIVAFPPGGLADALPRIIGEKLSQRWKQPVIIENRPGLGGGLGTAAFARVEPDGYTLLATPAGPIVTNGIVQKLNYDPLSLTPIVVLATSPIVLTSRLDFPAKSGSEFIRYGKANPGRLNYGTQGPGSTSHLTALLLQEKAAIQAVAVPYAGSAPALNDMMAGTVDFMFDNLGSSLPLHQGGKLKILAVASRERLKFLPEVPTMIESGLEDFFSFTWFAMFAPPKTDRELVLKINTEIADILNLPDVREKTEAFGAETRGGSPEDLAKLVVAEKARWEDVARRAGLAPPT
jgi:tripartite-type tricarboxylate transporter receptor subunit TctC